MYLILWTLDTSAKILGVILGCQGAKRYTWVKWDPWQCLLWQVWHIFFYAPRLNDWGHIVLGFSICLWMPVSLTDNFYIYTSCKVHIWHTYFLEKVLSECKKVDSLVIVTLNLWAQVVVPTFWKHGVYKRILFQSISSKVHKHFV